MPKFGSSADSNTGLGVYFFGSDGAYQTNTPLTIPQAAWDGAFNGFTSATAELFRGTAIGMTA